MNAPALRASVVASAGIQSFRQFVLTACTQAQVGAVGSWESPELVLSDSFVDAAWKWLLTGNNSQRSDFIFDTLLREGDEKRAILLADALQLGDLSDLKRTVVEALILESDIWRDLKEMCLGPDRRPSANEEHNDYYERSR